MTATHDPAERQAFLRAICAEPADDTVRLAFADWLDEHEGVDDGRAEFIRWQCGLLKVPELRTLQYFTTQAFKELRRQRRSVYKSSGAVRSVGYDESLKLMQRAQPIGERRFNEYAAHRAKLLGRERALLAAHELRWRSAGACPVSPVAMCSACEGCGDIGMLTGRTQIEGERDDWTYPVEFRRGFIEQITSPRLADVLERVTSAAELRPDYQYRPTARARAWLTHFPTVTRIVAADRTPYPINPGVTWWENPSGQSEEEQRATLPLSLFEEVWNAATFECQCRDAQGRWIEYPTAAAATDALAVALAGLIRKEAP